jgi:VIT1/CCC1 family predicted Fe2+/Mn2+ transporter
MLQPDRYSSSPFSAFLAQKIGGAAILTPIVRVTFWGALAMAVTAGIGAIVGTVV